MLLVRFTLWMLGSGLSALASECAKVYAPLIICSTSLNALK
jgi:hypothetical protein